MVRLPAAVLVVLVGLLQQSGAQGVACNAQGLSGHCATDCQDGIFLPGYCAAGGECCIMKLPSCNTPHGQGVCNSEGMCNGQSIPGYCPGPAPIYCCVGGTNYTFDYGLDLSEPASLASFQCLRKQGLTFVVVRCWRETNDPDPACPGSVANAIDAGLQVDAYFFPAYPNPVEQQFETFAQFVRANSIKFGRLWLDIEGTWGSDCNENTLYLQQLVNASLAHGFATGIYASPHSWQSIGFCGVYNYSTLPLWYPRYDYYGNEDNFNDWLPFASWQKPVAKQYKGTTSQCGAPGIDLDIRLTSYVP